MVPHAHPPLPGVPIESISSTKAQNEFGEVLDRVIHGAVIAITRRNKTSAILLPIEVFEQLIAHRVDPLASLGTRLDERFAKMQTKEAKAGIKALFSAGQEELGRAAMRAKKRG